MIKYRKLVIFSGLVNLIFGRVATHDDAKTESCGFVPVNAAHILKSDSYLTQLGSPTAKKFKPEPEFCLQC